MNIHDIISQWTSLGSNASKIPILDHQHSLHKDLNKLRRFKELMYSAQVLFIIIIIYIVIFYCYFMLY